MGCVGPIRSWPRAGRLLAQDEASSVVWGMPGAVSAAGLVDKLVPLDQIAAELIQCAAVGRLPGLPRAPLSTR